MSAHANSPADRAGSLWLPFLISIGIAVFLITLMPTVMFWDRDEAFYARAAVEMLQSGNWILPTYNDAVFPDKPPLIYWLMMFFMSIFGQNELGARFASAPATAASARLPDLPDRQPAFRPPRRALVDAGLRLIDADDLSRHHGDAGCRSGLFHLPGTVGFRCDHAGA